MISIFSCVSVFAKTSIITAEVRDGKANIILGFSDSSFDYKQNDTKREKTFCYIGVAKDVCPKIYYASMLSGGDRHDRMEVKACEVIDSGDGFHAYNEKVLTTYNLSDDYGSNFDVTRTIEKCSTSSLR